jgi:hypothetical protein
MKLNQIKPNPNNPRKITATQMKKLCESIKRDPEFMRLRPIVVDGDGMILGGNQRYAACLEMGMAEVPDGWVVTASSLTEEQRRRFVLVDNAPEGMAGEWDFDILGADWELPELKELGFNDGLFGAFEVEGTEAPALKDGDRAPFRQATFTLHDEQWEEVETALAKAKSDGGGESAVNENSNGNALAWICGRFNRG